jgi:hypothetical protein
MNRYFEDSKGHAKSFSVSWAKKKRLGPNGLSDFLNRPMGLRFNNMPSERLKIRVRWFRWSHVSWCRYAIRMHFFKFWAFKKAIWTKSRKWNLSRRMALRSHNLSSGRLKNRLWWIRWSDVSSFRKAIRPHFLHPVFRLKRLGWSHLSNVLSRLMALRNHNLSSDVLKNDFGEVDEAMSQGVERLYELIFCIPKIQKSDF